MYRKYCKYWKQYTKYFPEHEKYRQMSGRNVYCCSNADNCAINPQNGAIWYSKLIKPSAFVIITSLIGKKKKTNNIIIPFNDYIFIVLHNLAMSVSHLCDKYSASTTFKVISADLGNLKAHLGTLSVNIHQ